MKEEEDSVVIEWGDDKDLKTLAAKMKVDPKRKAANVLAYCVVGIFGAALLLILICGSALILTRSPQEAEQAISKCFVPLLQAVASFWSTIFGPPLWLILGYFFGIHRKGTRAK